MPLQPDPSSAALPNPISGPVDPWSALFGQIGAAGIGVPAVWTPDAQPPAPLEAADQSLNELSTLLQELEAGGLGHAAYCLTEARLRQGLVQVRLGIARGLFTALRCRHAPTADHSLRVTLTCAAWAAHMNMPAADRDALELAALFHDLWKIGVPDHILLKPTALTPEESAVMHQHRADVVAILRQCSASPAVHDVVAHCSTRFAGDQRGGPCGADLPFGARILAVADAWDAMTTDQLYRRAMSRERALDELYRCAGDQFDPELVRQFSELNQNDLQRLVKQVALGWLESLGADPAQAVGVAPAQLPRTAETNPEAVFQQKLLDNMYDAVVFVDQNLRIMRWNRAAERLTGISAGSVQERRFLPSLIDLRDEDNEPISDAKCPVEFAVRTGVQWLRRMSVRGRNGRKVAVNAHAVPVFHGDVQTGGATLLLHDVSPEVSLEARCQRLHERATKDPLTQVANRSEFDRVHRQFVAAHLEQGLPYSLIVCDIDHFKQVNDGHGHPAGDEVLKSFAALLKNSCRQGDLVARYGGEEFVLLCADCDLATAFRRSEIIRVAASKATHQAIGGKQITASFGVTEIQPGDTPETMLRRADRALYQAKAHGRNATVQLGCGSLDDDQDAPQAAVASSAIDSDEFASQTLITSVPLQVSLQKLRGFMSDHYAEVVSVETNTLQLRVGADSIGLLRRNSDRRLKLILRLEFFQEQLDAEEHRGRSPRTKVVAAVAPERSRDRRRADATECASQILRSLKSYLMASLESPNAGQVKWRKVTQMTGLGQN